MCNNIFVVMRQRGAICYPVFAFDDRARANSVCIEQDREHGKDGATHRVCSVPRNPDQGKRDVFNAALSLVQAG